MNDANLAAIDSRQGPDAPIAESVLDTTGERQIRVEFGAVKELPGEIQHRGGIIRQWGSSPGGVPSNGGGVITIERMHDDRALVRGFRINVDRIFFRIVVTLISSLGGEARDGLQPLCAAEGPQIFCENCIGGR